MGNNPILFIDPDGEKIIIHYKDKNGKDQYYEYGSKMNVPNDVFVKKTIQSLDKLAASQSIKTDFKFINETDKYEVTIKKPSWPSPKETKASTSSVAVALLHSTPIDFEY